MVWILEAGTLIVVAVVLRRMLHLDSPRPKFRFWRGSAESDALYERIGCELKTDTAILAVSLNEAFEEYKRGHDGVAWPLVRLCDGEWSRLVERVREIQVIASRYLPAAEMPLPVRQVESGEFRSRVMVEYVKLYGVLDQFIFRSKFRFQLYLRLLRRATEMLSEEFHRATLEVSGEEAALSQILSEMDVYFHDLDVVGQETLLALRSLLSCLPESTLKEMTTEVEAALGPATQVPVRERN